MSHHIFLDLETTGLDSEVDQITEAAWILDSGIERQVYVEHNLLPNKWVLQNTDYIARILPAQKKLPGYLRDVLEADCWQSGFGKTYLVGANPSFDDRFLRALFYHRLPYQYHLIDIEAVVMGKLGWTEPRSLNHLREALGIPGENPAPHTALSDAREVKIIWDALHA